MAKKYSKKSKLAKSKKEISTARAFFYVFTFFIFLICTVFTLHYKQGIQLYLCANYNKFCDAKISEFDTTLDASDICKNSSRISITAFNIRNLELIEQHSENHIFGIDVSEYQGEINWENIYCTEDVAPINFVIMRATAGIDKQDNQFKENWKQTKKNKFIRGAYHYYRPDEDPTEQAQNFINTVSLHAADLPPILDVEKKPKKITNEQFIANINVWLKVVTKHYNVKPILYSGQSFHEDYLQAYFTNYILWIANYNFFTEKMQPHWHMWQFTEKGYVSGIKGNVDVNIFRGNITDLKAITIK